MVQFFDEDVHNRLIHLLCLKSWFILKAIGAAAVRRQSLRRWSNTTFILKRTPHLILRSIHFQWFVNWRGKVPVLLQFLNRFCLPDIYCWELRTSYLSRPRPSKHIDNLTLFSISFIQIKSLLQKLAWLRLMPFDLKLLILTIAVLVEIQAQIPLINFVPLAYVFLPIVFCFFHHSGGLYGLNGIPPSITGPCFPVRGKHVEILLIVYFGFHCFVILKML